MCPRLGGAVSGIAVYCGGLTVCTNADVEKMVAACAKQMVEHFCPAYSRLPIGVAFYADKSTIPAGMPSVLVSDVCDDPQALAYHTEGTDGRITGLVGAKTILDDNGSLFTGEVSVSGALSHELVETAFDPFCNKWFLMPNGRQLMAGETADPVQDLAYEIDGVAMSDFVLPEFWDDMPGSGSKFDYLGHLKAPFTKSAGGYYMLDMGGRVVQEGMRAPRKAKHPLARAMRRLGQGA